MVVGRAVGAERQIGGKRDGGKREAAGEPREERWRRRGAAAGHESGRIRGHADGPGWGGVNDGRYRRCAGSPAQRLAH